MTVRVLGVIAALVMAGCAAAPSAPPDVPDATASPSPAPTSEGTPVDPLTGELQALAQRLLPPGATVTGGRETPAVVELYGRSELSLKEVEEFWRATLIALGRGFSLGPDPFGRVTADLYDPHGRLTARPSAGGAGVEIVVSLTREVAASPSPAKVIVTVEVTEATPCCEAGEAGPGQVTGPGLAPDWATLFELRREHPAAIDGADMFIAIRKALVSAPHVATAPDRDRCVAYAVPDARVREVVLRYLAFRGTDSSLRGEEFLVSGDEPQVRGAVHVAIADLRVTRREGPTYRSGSFTLRSYGYDLRADIGVSRPEGGEPAAVSLQAEFPDDVTIQLPRARPYFAGASLDQLAAAMLPRVGSVVGDPCAP